MASHDFGIPAIQRAFELAAVAATLEPAGESRGGGQEVRQWDNQKNKEMWKIRRVMTQIIPDHLKHDVIERILKRKREAWLERMDLTLTDFKKIPKFDELFFSQWTDEGFEGRLRFKFGVLRGGGGAGITTWALSQWGFGRTYHADCLGQKEPPLDGFNYPDEHDALVLSSAGPELIENCKVFLQSGKDRVRLHHSKCQKHTKAYDVFRLPIIICTNECFCDNDQSELARWARQCSVFHELADGERLYES